MPRCKNCKQKFEVVVFNQKYCFKDDCVREFNRVTWQKERKPKMKAAIGYSKSQKSYLQDEINKLSKIIDKSFGYINCIDCDKEMKLIHAAHFHNVQGNENIRYNLHNLHSSRAHCNQYSSEHKVGYRKGLESRYDENYRNFVEFELPLKYQYLGLKSNEIKEALKTTRKIIREFENYKFNDAIQARTYFNELIGIYK